MELPIFGNEIFKEALAIFHLKVEFVIALSLQVVRIVVLQQLLQFVELTLLELAVLLVFLVLQDLLCVIT